VEQGRRPVADGGGAAPVVRGGGERVWELHYGERNLAAGSIWGEEGRRRGLRVELWGGGGHGGGGGTLAVLCDGDWVGEDQEAGGSGLGRRCGWGTGGRRRSTASWKRR